jgi:hypothetical protein
MRRIQTPEEIEKKRKRNSLLMGIFMLGILVLSTAGFAFFLNPDALSNGNDNTADVPTSGSVGNRWTETISGQQLYFTNSPNDVEDIPVDITLFLHSYSGLPLFLNSENAAINTEIATTLGRFASRVQEACYGECDNPDLPEKNCNENLIIWKDSIENKVYQEENCVFIEGDIGAVDAFLFKILGVN